jgi:hypothetical protein
MAFEVIFNVAGTKPSEVTVKDISPACLVVFTITCARPQKAFRFH